MSRRGTRVVFKGTNDQGTAETADSMTDLFGGVSMSTVALVWQEIRRRENQFGRGSTPLQTGVIRDNTTLTGTHTLHPRLMAH